MAYRDKIDPTRDGFQELWDSMQDPTIEMLMAGVQKKKPTKAQLLDLTDEMRKSHTTLDRELLRLGEFSEDYNSKWATKNTYAFGTTEELQAKSQSQLLRWRKMLKITSPRYKENSTPESVYKASYLTHKPYELDMWGPASYGTLLYDLYDEMSVLIDHLEDGKQLCKDVMQKEEEINQDPEWKEQLHDRQFQQIAEKNRDVIEKRYNAGHVDTDNQLYKAMLASPSRRDFKSNYFHKPNEHEYADFVVTLSTLMLQKNEITPKEHELWGEDFEKIKMFRFAIENLDVLLKVNKNGKFDKYETLEFIKWCKVNENAKRHVDVEHTLYEYIQKVYSGSHTWYGWTSIFDLNKTVKESVTASMAYSSRFESKFTRLCVERSVNFSEE